jgi:hypothetical protein
MKNQPHDRVSRARTAPPTVIPPLAPVDVDRAAGSEVVAFKLDEDEIAVLVLEARRVMPVELEV